MRALVTAIAVSLTGVAPAAAAQDGRSGPGEVPDVPRPEPNRWTIALGTGAGSIFEFADDPPHDVGAGLATSGSERSGRVQLDVHADRELGERFRAGVSYMYLRWIEAYSSPGGVSAGEKRTSVHVVLADVTYRWMRSSAVELYSGLGLGGGVSVESGEVLQVPQDRTQGGFAFQLRLLGISLGGERFRAFGELGIGFEALLLGGVAVRF
jgi:hypothetical protein